MLVIYMIKGMLEKNPNKRLSLDKIINSYWLKEV